jgi:catechol 2,3-dioxygenase-like lactoylglutathione lyase family enzyme
MVVSSGDHRRRSSGDIFYAALFGGLTRQEREKPERTTGTGVEKGDDRMITSLHHASFTVEDLDRSVVFYRDVLGLTLSGVFERDGGYSERITGIRGAKLRVAFFALPNSALELVEYTEGKGVAIDTTTNNVGSAHVCFTVDRFNEFAEHLRRHGVRFAGEICVGPSGANKGKKLVYIKDPDGNTMELLSTEVLA